MRPPPGQPSALPRTPRARAERSHTARWRRGGGVPPDEEPPGGRRRARRPDAEREPMPERPVAVVPQHPFRQVDDHPMANPMERDVSGSEPIRPIRWVRRRAAPGTTGCPPRRRASSGTRCAGPTDSWRRRAPAAGDTGSDQTRRRSASARTTHAQRFSDGGSGEPRGAPHSVLGRVDAPPGTPGSTRRSARDDGALDRVRRGAVGDVGARCESEGQDREAMRTRPGDHAHPSFQMA